MSKLRTFSERVTTGYKAHSRTPPTVRSSKPSFFRSYQEVEVAMGPPDFQKLMKELRAWKKSGKEGVFRAKLKGNKKEVKLKVSEDREKYEMGPLRGIASGQRSRVKKKLNESLRYARKGRGFTLEQIEEIFNVANAPVEAGYIRVYDPYIVGDFDDPNWRVVDDLGFADVRKRDYLMKQPFIPYSEIVGSLGRNPYIPQGDNYHSSVGWY